MITRKMSLALSLLASLFSTAAAFAQGPWPTLNRPTMATPIQEFVPARNQYYSAPSIAPAQTNWSGVGYNNPACANGACAVRQYGVGAYGAGTCPNGQCPAGACRNGQCATPMRSRVNSNYGPQSYGQGGGCPNGQCSQNRAGMTSGYRNMNPVYAPNLFQGFPFPARSLPTPQQPMNGYQGVNRLTPMNGGYQMPAYIGRSSEAEFPELQTTEEDIRLQ